MANLEISNGNLDLPVPPLEFIFNADVTVDSPLELGDVGKGARRIVPIPAVRSRGHYCAA